MTYQCDILYNLQDFEIDKAIIAFDPTSPLDVEWPLDAINDALYYFYDVNDARPWIYVIRDDGGVIGYVVAERDDPLTSDDTYQAYVGMLSEQGLFDHDTLAFTRDVPFACSGEWDGVTIGICAHPQRFGEVFPSTAVNRAIWNLMGQSDWPSSKQLWLYPVRKDGQSAMSGLIVQSKVDGIGDNDLIDDVMFKDLAEQNMQPIGESQMQFQPERLTIR